MVKIGENNQRKWNIIFSCLLILSLIATATKLFIGFDIDEAYAVVMPFRLLQQDRLFGDMWEVHQTSSFLPYLFIALFCRITGGVTYLVLYLRIVATVIHLLLSLWVYRVLKPYFEQYAALFFALVYYNFLPKWMMNLDFSMQQLWFMTISLVFLFYGFRKRGKFWYFLCGVALAFAVLAYPGMVLLYPVYLVIVWMKEKNKSGINNCLLVTAGCAVTAVIFFACVLSRMSLGDFLHSIPMVFSDGSHQFTFATKFGLYAKQWMEVLIQSVILVIPSAILTFLYSRVTKTKMSLTAFCMLFTYISSGIVVVANLIGLEWGPFRLQVRYLILFVLAFLLYAGLKKKKSKHTTERNSWIFRLLLLPSIGMFAGILLASNVGPVSSASYLVLADMAFLMLYLDAVRVEQEQKEETVAERKGIWRFLKGDGIYRWAAVLFLVSLALCKGYYVRVTEYEPSNLLERRVSIEDGAAKGIWVSPQEFERISDNYDTIRNTVIEGQCVLFMGTESLNNLTAYEAGAEFVSATTISTPAFNEQWTTYFEQHSDKQPDVIFIAKNTIDNREKFFSQNDFGQWIAGRYDVEHMEETEYLCILHEK